MSELGKIYEYTDPGRDVIDMDLGPAEIHMAAINTLNELAIAGEAAEPGRIYDRAEATLVKMPDLEIMGLTFPQAAVERRYTVRSLEQFEPEQEPGKVRARLREIGSAVAAVEAIIAEASPLGQKVKREAETQSAAITQAIESKFGHRAQQ